MYFLNTEQARRILLNENMTADQAESMLRRFSPVDDTLGPPIDAWLRGAALPTVIVDGISLRDVMEKRHSHFLTAVQDLNRLLDPELTAEKRQQWRRILTTPVYYE